MSPRLYSQRSKTLEKMYHRYRDAHNNLIFCHYYCFLGMILKTKSGQLDFFTGAIFSIKNYICITIKI